MRKALKSWSRMRKYLEKDMLADSLKGRIRYSATTFVGMDGAGVFEIFVDDKSIKRFSMETVASDLYKENKPVAMEKYWANYWAEKYNTPIENRREYDDTEFSEALRLYRSLNIQEAIYSINPIVRMFAILDRRVGKRTLEKLQDKICEQPKWLQCLYKLRIDSENIGLSG